MSENLEYKKDKISILKRKNRITEYFRKIITDIHARRQGTYVARPKSISNHTPSPIPILQLNDSLSTHEAYHFLFESEYDEFRALFGGDLQYSDRIDEGNNAIIFHHPTRNSVIKVRKPKGDPLSQEFENHLAFYKQLRVLKQDTKDESRFIKKFFIPRIYEVS
jgi:hypothetical protein